MKIVWWIDHLGLGGSQKVLKQLVIGLSDSTRQQAVVCLNNVVNTEFLRQLEMAGVEVRVLGKLQIATGFGLLSTLIWLRKNHFDVSVTFLFFSDVIGTVLSWLVGIDKRISSQRGSNLDYDLWQERCLRIILPLAHRIVLNTKHIKKSVSRYLSPTAEIKIINNGVDVRSIQKIEEGLSLHHELNLLSDAVLIGYVGRLSSEKGLITLIQALTLIERQDLYLIIAGTGKQREALENMVRSMGLEAKVYFLGYRSDIPNMLRQFNVYVQASYFEGMSNSLMEAMAVGCPIIATSVGGNHELIRNGQDGQLVQYDDPQHLALTIGRVLSNPNETAKRVASARQRIEQSYTEKFAIDSWKAILGVLDV